MKHHVPVVFSAVFDVLSVADADGVVDKPLAAVEVVNHFFEMKNQIDGNTAETNDHSKLRPIYPMILSSQHAHWTLNKIKKTFNGTFAG